MQMELFSPRETADKYGWPVARIRQLIAKKEIRHIRIGGSVFLPGAAVDEYVALNMIEPQRKHSNAEEHD